MTWSYSGDPASSSRDEVRFLTGDTDSTEPKLSDEEIYYLLTLWGDEDTYLVAAAAAEQMAASAASFLSYTADGVSLTLSDLQSKYLTMAQALRDQRVRLNRPEPYAGGTDVGDVNAHDNDQSVVHTDFGTGMHDNQREGALGGATKKDLLGGPW